MDEEVECMSGARECDTRMPTVWHYLLVAAHQVVEAVDFNHDNKAEPLKWTVPWAKVTALRDAVLKAKALDGAPGPALPPGDDARLAIEELKNIINARRRDRDNFADDTEFADWVLSRARYTLGVIERASETKCAVCNDTGSVQDSEVPYLGNPCPECK